MSHSLAAFEKLQVTLAGNVHKRLKVCEHLPLTVLRAALDDAVAHYRLCRVSETLLNLGLPLPATTFHKRNRLATKVVELDSVFQANKVP
jgi:hypothetical protein